MCDLRIEEKLVNEEVLQISKIINQLVAKYNDWLAQSEQNRNLVKKVFKPIPSGTKRLPTFQCSGRMTEHFARLYQTILASTYKCDGRKISRSRAADNAARDINEINVYLKAVEYRAASVVMKRGDMKWLKNTVETIKELLSSAEESRQAIQKSPVSVTMRGATQSGHDSNRVRIWVLS